MYTLYEIQRDDMLPSNFQFMDTRTKEIHRFTNIIKAAGSYDLNRPFVMFYPRRNFVVHDKNINDITSHYSFTYLGDENKIVINFRFINMDINFKNNVVILYERYTRYSTKNENAVPFFMEYISIDDFMSYRPYEIKKVLWKVLMKIFTIHEVTSRHWRFSLSHITEDVIDDIQKLIIRERKKC